MPGETNGIYTLQVNGELITDKKRIDNELCHYWKGVFTKKNIKKPSADKLKEWLQETDRNFHPPEDFDVGKNTRRHPAL